jgi:hypothetical protein
MSNPALTKLVSDARADDLRREMSQATRRREAGAPPIGAPEAADLAITIRRALPSDADALARLAELDSAPRLVGEVLIAEAGGELRAALSLSDGASIADPFHGTAATVQLLVLRAAQLCGTRRQRGRLGRALRTPVLSRLWRTAATRTI